MQQVVMKLQELCRAVLAVEALKERESNAVNGIMNEAAQSKAKQDLKESILSSIETSTVCEMTHTKIPNILDQENDVSNDSPCSRMLAIHESPDVLEVDNEKRADNLIKFEAGELESCNEQQNNCNNQVKKIKLLKVIKEEHKVGNGDVGRHIDNIINTTVSYRAQGMGYLANISHEADETTTCRRIVDSVQSNEGSSTCAIGDDLILAGKQERVSKQLCGNKDKIDLRDLSRSRYQKYCKEHDSTSTNAINPTRQSENSLISASNENVFGSINFNGCGCSTDEETRSCKGYIQKPGSECRIGKRKRVSHNLTSLSTEEVSDDSASGSMGDGKLIPTLKNPRLKGEVLFNTSNREVMLVSGTEKLSYQEVVNSGLTRSSINSRYASSSASIAFSGANSRRCVTPAQSWSPTLLSTSSNEKLCGYLESDSSEVVCGTLPGLYAERLCQDVCMLQSNIPVPNPAISISSATMVHQEGSRPGTETLKSQEELFRRLEESLAETETLKYHEEELLKKIERSLTETESLKCREEELLRKIEKSLTDAESLKSREEELLRRIEVSLAQTETVKSQDEELLIRMKVSLTDKKYNLADIDSIRSMDYKSEYKPDLDCSLPLKKRKNRLKTLAYDEGREFQVRSLPPEGFPSFPSRPMISIAQLGAVGKLQQHLNFPSYPSIPMISIAELEALTTFGNLQQHTVESSTATPKSSKYPHYYGQNNFCEGSLYSRDGSVERSYGDIFEQNVRTVGNNRVFPTCKFEESTKGCTCNTCDISKLRDCNQSCDELFRRTEPSSAEPSSSNCSDEAEDSKANINLLVGLSADSVSSNTEVDSKDNVNIEICGRTKDSSADSFIVDSKDNERLHRENEATLTGFECDGRDVDPKNSNSVLESSDIPSSNLSCVESKNSVKLETPIELIKCIKVEADSKDRIEHSGTICPLSSDSKYKEDMNSEMSIELSRFTKVDVNSNDIVELLGSTCGKKI